MTAPPEATTRTGTRRFSQLVLRRRESTIAIVALTLGAYFTAANDVFLTADNLRVVSQYMIAPAILGAGQVMLLISGEIDRRESRSRWRSWPECWGPALWAL
jgi:simple sugar transport system permease protein